MMRSNAGGLKGPAAGSYRLVSFLTKREFDRRLVASNS